MKPIKALPVLFLIIGAILLSACDTQAEIPEDTPTATLQLTDITMATKTTRPTPTPTPVPEGVEVVRLKAPDSTELVGYLQRSDALPEGNLVVVLAHGHTQSHVEWDYFNEILIDHGYSTMRFDFRGHGGSSGTENFATIGDDVKTVIDFLKQEGFNQIVCIGSSMGGSACLAAAVTTEIQGLVSLSGPMNIPGTSLVTKSGLESLTYPKIFMVSLDDYFPGTLEGVRQLNKLAPEPKQYYEYEGTAHGSGFFYDTDGEQVLQILLDFLKDLVN